MMLIYVKRGSGSSDICGQCGSRSVLAPEYVVKKHVSLTLSGQCRSKIRLRELKQNTIMIRTTPTHNEKNTNWMVTCEEFRYTRSLFLTRQNLSTGVLNHE